MAKDTRLGNGQIPLRAFHKLFLELVATFSVGEGRHPPNLLKRPGTAPQARPADTPLLSPATVPPLSNGTSDAAWVQDVGH